MVALCSLQCGDAKSAFWRNTTYSFALQILFKFQPALFPTLYLYHN